MSYLKSLHAARRTTVAALSLPKQWGLLQVCISISHAVRPSSIHPRNRRIQSSKWGSFSPQEKEQKVKTKEKKQYIRPHYSSTSSTPSDTALYFPPTSISPHSSRFTETSEGVWVVEVPLALHCGGGVPSVPGFPRRSRSHCVAPTQVRRVLK